MKKKHTVGQIMLNQEEIYARAAEIGKQISEDYAGETVVVIGILKGAVLWLSDVIKNITIDTEIDFMAVSSYGAATRSSGVVKIVKDLDRPIEGAHVIVVEDIIDSGITLNYLRGYLLARGPKTLSFCTLLDKPTGRRTEFKAEYVGFEVEDKFIVGYGLDYDQRYRNLPYISFLD